MSNLTKSIDGSTTTIDNAKSTTIKIWKTTLQKLRFLHAYTGEPMVEILNELVEVELEKYQNDEIKNE